MRTRSPTLRCSTPLPTPKTRPTPSLPTMLGSEGRTGNAPRIRYRSFGLIGAYSTPTNTSPLAGVAGSGTSTSSSTSIGSPKALIITARIGDCLHDGEKCAHLRLLWRDGTAVASVKPDVWFCASRKSAEPRIGAVLASALERSPRCRAGRPTNVHAAVGE